MVNDSHHWKSTKEMFKSISFMTQVFCCPICSKHFFFITLKENDTLGIQHCIDFLCIDLTNIQPTPSFILAVFFKLKRTKHQKLAKFHFHFSPIFQHFYHGIHLFCPIICFSYYGITSKTTRINFTPQYRRYNHSTNYNTSAVY